MECYQCLQSGIFKESVGLCRHCSAALCLDHIFAVDEPIMVRHMMAPATVFSKKARLVLCITCKMALDQLQPEPATSADISR